MSIVVNHKEHESQPQSQPAGLLLTLISRLSGGNKFLDAGLNGRGVSPDNFVIFLALFEVNYGRHSANTELLGDVGDLVDVDLVEFGLGVILAEFFDFRRYRFAWPAPWCPAV